MELPGRVRSERPVRLLDYQGPFKWLVFERPEAKADLRIDCDRALPEIR
jgi:hypothetical protein